MEILASGNAEDISGTYEQIGELIKRLEKSKDATADYLMETDKDLEYIPGGGGTRYIPEWGGAARRGPSYPNPV